MLFSDHIENIQLSDFEISPFGRPRSCGVYAVWARNFPWETGVNHLLYIGSTVNIRKRLENSKHPYMQAYNKLQGIVFISFFETYDYLKLEKNLFRLINQY